MKQSEADPRTRGLVAAIAVATTAGIGISMLYPLLALALERMEARATTIGALATVGSLATLAITPLIPKLMQRVGTIPLLTASVVIAIVVRCCSTSGPRFGSGFHYASSIVQH